MITSAKRAAGLCALLASTCLVSPAGAQSSADQPTPPRDYNLDENGVDLVTGQYYLSMTDVRVGNADGGLSYSRTLRTNGYDDPYETALNMVAGEYDVSIGAISDNFRGPNGFSTQGNGAKLAAQPSGDFLYTTKDGTRYLFSKTVHSTRFRVAQYRATNIFYPDGRSVRIEYTINTSPSYHVTRPSAVSSNDGYRLTFRYQADTLEGSDAARFARWMTIASVTASNSAVEHCTPQSCLPSDPRWRSTTYAWSADKTQETRTDAAGRAMVTTIDAAGRITAIKTPGATLNRIVLTRDSFGRVETFQNSGATWRYDRSAGPLKVISPTGLTRVVTVGAANKILTDKLGTGGTTTYEYDDKKRLTKVISPEGNAVAYTYDTRDNVTSATTFAKDGASAFAVTASYPVACDDADALTCNKPTSVTDARGKTTDYVYDSRHGGVTKITRPSPDGQAPRPEVRFTYAQVQASFYGSNGSIVQGGPVWKLTETSECSVGSASNCVDTANETRTEIGYATPGPGNNLLPTSVTSRAGDNSVNSSLAMTYNKLGDVATVDGPLAGSGDTTVYGYDAAGAVDEVRSPSHDAVQSRASRATKIIRDAEERVDETLTGYYPINPDGSQGAFVVSQTVKSRYNPDTGLKVADTLLANGAAIQLTQYGYDADQRLSCTAFRINRAESQDACVNAGGGSGDDIIEQLIYGPDGRLASTQKGGILVAGYTFTPNGQIATLTDGESNRTTYEYDGVDRLRRTLYPVKARGANASIAVSPDGSGDYEQLDYDANGNVTSRRLRDGQVLGYTYDALNRRTNDDNPNTNVAEVDVVYAYDNLDRLRSASDQNGWHNSFEYDALGRATRQYSNVGSNSLQYDAAGRMTRQAWADGFFVTYEHDQTGAMTRIREKGELELARFGYDELGRRRTLTRGNNTITTYGYNSGSQLTSLVQELVGDTQDLRLDFDFDGLGRIKSRTLSNDAYAFTGTTNASRSYTANGLNQYSQAGAVVPTYDGRGNVTNVGGQSYTYNTRNQLITNGAGQLFYRNPMGQFARGAGINNDYVGDHLVTEVSGGVARRYVHGPGVDEPLVWYEGTGTGDRRYLHADERGSVIAVTNDAGAAITINTYDEHGLPGSGNRGRFQYIGQQWIVPLGLYDYKARMYSPQLGRFMQMDPIGYADGMNLYAYVGGDPVNRIDPSGLQASPSHTPDGHYHGRTIQDGRSTGAGIGLGSGIDELRAPNGGTFNYNGLMIWDPIPSLASSEVLQDGSVLTAQRKGERGRAASNKGTPKPDKHMKPVPGRPGFGQIKDPQTGKLSGPKPWPNDPRLNPPTNFSGPNNRSLPNQPSSTSWAAAALSGLIVIGAGALYVLGTVF